MNVPADADRRPIEFTDRGDRSQPVVVLHPSLGRPAADFDDLCARLGDAGYRTIAVDPRGVAGSPAATGPVTLADLADDVADAMRRAGAERVHLIGHAHGNRVVRCLAARRPGTARSITLLAAGGRIPPEPAASSALRRCFVASLPEADRLAAIELAFFAPGHSGRAWLEGWYSGAAAHRRPDDDTPVDVWWDGGDAPMLVVQGLQDRIAPPENGRLLAATRPDVTLHEIDGAGHALLPEQPEEIAVAVIGFLDRHG